VWNLSEVPPTMRRGCQNAQCHMTVQGLGVLED
jgi:hypothetical protein